MSTFKKAIKQQAFLKLAIYGASGSGKTYSALAIATGLGGRIALIDSERSSAALYADNFTFDTVDLNVKIIDEYIHYIKAAASEKYDVLIIDSLSHAWTALLEEVEQIAKAKYKGNSWAAWSEATPKQNNFIDAILNYPGHIIVTMRSKTEWVQGKDDKGKTTYKNVGAEPIQGKGIEYEFSFLLEISSDHAALVIKDRTGKFQDKIIEKPSAEFGKQLIEWLNTPQPISQHGGGQATPQSQPTHQNGGVSESISYYGQAVSQNGGRGQSAPQSDDDENYRQSVLQQIKDKLEAHNGILFSDTEKFRFKGQLMNARNDRNKLDKVYYEVEELYQAKINEYHIEQVEEVVV